MPEYSSRLALLISILKEACTSAASSAATSTVVTELDKKASWPLLLRGKMHKALVLYICIALLRWSKVT